MRFQLSAVFLFLLNASASSFATQAPTSSLAHTQRSYPAFLPRGGTSSLHASVASETAVTAENLALLSERGRATIQRLVENDQHGSQKHVYGGWPEAGVEDGGKQRLAEQVSDFMLDSIAVSVPSF